MFVCRNLFTPHIQDGYEQSESKRETTPRGEQSAVREEPAIQDHVRGNVSTLEMSLPPGPRMFSKNF